MYYILNIVCVFENKLFPKSHQLQERILQERIFTRTYRTVYVK